MQVAPSDQLPSAPNLTAEAPTQRRSNCLATLAVLFLLAMTSVESRSEDEKPTSSGTGFVVSRQGHVLTNHHVVEQCPSVRVLIDGVFREAMIAGVDEKNDLALLKLSRPHLNAVARFRQGRSIRSGDSVVVVGFPYHSLLASEAHVTTGAVSALAGLRNDARFLQIAAPVQPGNSGGPVLDKSGHVVGIVESKLNGLAMALITGDIPQNVNFAIKDAIAKVFLESHGVTYELGGPDRQLEPAEIGDLAKRFTLLIECYSESIDTKAKRVEAERRARADAKRQEEAAREERRLQEQQERLAAARQLEAERKSAEKAERQQEKERTEREAAEMRAASLRVTQFHEAERLLEDSEHARQKGEEARILALRGREEVGAGSGEMSSSNFEEARRKGQEERQRALADRAAPQPSAMNEPQPIAGLPIPRQPQTNLQGTPAQKGATYWARVESIIRSHWEPPPIEVRGLTYSVTVRFRLFRNGTVKDVWVVKGSGNSYFDDAGRRAVSKSRQLPPFSAEIEDPYQDIEMVFRVGEEVQ